MNSPQLPDVSRPPHARAGHARWRWQESGSRQSSRDQLFGAALARSTNLRAPGRRSRSRPCSPSRLRIGIPRSKVGICACRRRVRSVRAHVRARLRTSAYACACVCVPRRDACAQRVVLTPPTCLLWGLLSAARGHASIRSRACLRPCNVRKRVTQQLFATLGAHARDGTRWQTVEGQHDVNGQLQRG